MVLVVLEIFINNKKNTKLWCAFSGKFKYWYGWTSVSCQNLLVCWSSCWIFLHMIFKGENCTDVILWLLPFYTNLKDLDPGWGSQTRRKSKPVGFIILHTISLFRMKFDMVLKQFKLNILISLLVIVGETKEITAVLLTASKTVMWAYIGCLWIDLVQRWCDADAVELYILVAV